ncbi:hypothetical protein M405DRAFT_773793 [Rhizopogon salebrosus TDB-379]|nr:hypothetical protein M405DRAFT_773793 [Rhizopogon salebrosus TDB-379]
MLAAFALAFLAAISAYADPNPTNPGPGNVFIEGQACSITWTPDTTGVWKTMTIELRTGDNFNMINLALVGTVDGTDATKNSFSYPCPQVTPYSPIYFYQFNSPAANNSVWTGRFTITDNVNDIVPAAQSTQPDGEAIPWGVGQLVNGNSTASAPASTTSLASSTTALDTPLTTSSSDVTTSSTASPSSSAAAQTGTGGGLALSAQSLGWQAALTLGVSALGFALVL